jgi:tRNA-specific 2-thiouridylase
MSGGVDSSVTAALLKERGYDVVGVYMHNWDRDDGCDPDLDRRDALKVALKLRIPFKVFDFRREYRREVMAYFYREYAAGRTPNPDVICNRQIKFGAFLERAVDELGVDYIATGHYARIIEAGNWKMEAGSDARSSGLENSSLQFPASSRASSIQTQASDYRLLKGVDSNKDQSYFLWTLTQKQLAKTLFPVGGMTKKEVREKARQRGLPVAAKPDSTGICFVGDVNIREFIKKRLPEKPGEIVDMEGNVLGRHPGAHFYTVGQRQGLGIGGGIPYYVVSTDVDQNLVIVAPRSHPAHYSSAMVVGDVNWVAGGAPSLPLECSVKIRYRQEDVSAQISRRPRVFRDSPQDPLRISKINRGANPMARCGKPLGLLVVFAEPQRAVTPGQSAVFYRGEELLGGGVIESRQQYVR